MVEEKCKKCGAPLTEKNRCKCEESVCWNCCSCPEDCSCGCKNKNK